MNTPMDQNVWRTSGGDCARRGLFSGEFNPHPQPARTLQARGSVQAPVVFDRQGTLFVADMSGNVLAYGEGDDPLWVHQLEGGISAAPVLNPEDSHLFVGTHRGWVYALDTARGEILWQKQLPSKSDLRILSDFLYVPQIDAVVMNSWGGKYYALDAARGEEKFSWDSGIAPYAAASAEQDGTLHSVRAVGDKGIQWVAISPQGAETILYTQPQKDRPANRLRVKAAPVLDEERAVIYIVTNIDQQGLLHAFSLQDHALRWTHAFPRFIDNTPAIRHDGAIVVSDLFGNVDALAPDQTRLYQYASGCEYLLAAAVSDQKGTVYVGDPVGCIHRIDEKGIGQPVFEAERSLQARFSFDPSGRLAVPCTDQRIYIFDKS